MDKIDDLDLVGNLYRSITTIEGDRDAIYPITLWRGTENLIVPYDDPRYTSRYDADRFFARFAKYGVTRTLIIPPGEWKESLWKDTFFIFPLDQSNE